MFLSSLSNFFPARFNTKELHCSGGVKNGTVCENSDKCVSGPLYYTNSCSKKKSVRGLCVGGQNHGQFCGGSLDCPPKKHSDSTEDTVEYGVCVGAALDEGKVIPKNDISGTGFGRGLERLLELFPAWFNTWEWKDGRYTLYQDNNSNKANTPTGFHTHENKYDYTKAKNQLFSSDSNCASYSTGSCNPNANIDPKPPTVSFVDEQNKLIIGNSTITGDSSLNFILRFRAFADHDQMPIVRMAVDWGDGSTPYVVQGWFKNRKKYCGAQIGNKYKVCKNDSAPFDYDLNKSCKVDFDCGMGFICGNDPDNRLHFGSSSSACEEGFYQFTHIYECVSGGVGWKDSTKSCKFTPKVQALDNWGWCNSLDGKGRWNDEIDSNTGKIKQDKQHACYWDKSEPWTSFGGTIEVKK